MLKINAIEKFQKYNKIDFKFECFRGLQLDGMVNRIKSTKKINTFQLSVCYFQILFELPFCNKICVFQTN